MRRTIVFALLISVIGFALGWLGLSVRDVYREQAAAAQAQVKPSPGFPSTNSNPFGFPHPYFDPFTQSPTLALPPPPPPPPIYKTPTTCPYGDPCKQRETWFL